MAETGQQTISQEPNEDDDSLVEEYLEEDDEEEEDDDGVELLDVHDETVQINEISSSEIIESIDTQPLANSDDITSNVIEEVVEIMMPTAVAPVAVFASASRRSTTTTPMTTKRFLEVIEKIEIQPANGVVIETTPHNQSRRQSTPRNRTISRHHPYANSSNSNSNSISISNSMRSKALYPNIPNENQRHTIMPPPASLCAVVRTQNKRMARFPASMGHSSIASSSNGSRSSPLEKRQLRSSSCHVDYSKRMLRTRNNFAKDLKAKTPINGGSLKRSNTTNLLRSRLLDQDINSNSNSNNNNNNGSSSSGVAASTYRKMQVTNAGPVGKSQLLGSPTLSILTVRAMNLRSRQVGQLPSSASSSSTITLTPAGSSHNASLKGGNHSNNNNGTNNKNTTTFQRGGDRHNLRSLHSRNLPSGKKSTENSITSLPPPPSRPSPSSGLTVTATVSLTQKSSSSSASTMTTGSFSKTTRLQSSSGSTLAPPPPSPKLIGNSGPGPAMRSRTMLKNTVRKIFQKRTSLRSSSSSTSNGISNGHGAVGNSGHSLLHSVHSSMTTRNSTRISRKLKR